MAKRMEKHSSIPSSVGMLLNVDRSISLLTHVDMRTSAAEQTFPSTVETETRAKIAINVAQMQKIETRLFNIFVVRARNIKSQEINVPLDVKVKSKTVEGLQAKIRKINTGFVSLQQSYTTEYDQHTLVPKETVFKVQ